MTPVQRWFFTTQDDDRDHWNQAFLFTTPADLDVAALEAAANVVLAHHDAFRLRFAAGPGPRAWFAPAPPLRVESVDLAHVPPSERSAAVERICTRAQGTLDIARGPLLALVHLRLGAGLPGRLLIAAHHLVVDGVSWRVIVEDLETAYRAHRCGEPPTLPAKTTSVQAWGRALHAYAASAELARERAFWETLLAAPSLSLPRDRGALAPVLGEERETEARTIVRSLSAEETARLLGALPAAYEARIDEVLLAALAAALGPWVGAGSLVIDCEGHGREDLFPGLDLSRTVGWFTAVYPVRLTLGERDPARLLPALRTHVRSLPHRGFGYGLLRFGETAEPVRPSGAELVFNYLGRFDAVTATGGLFAFAPESAGAWRGPRSRRTHRVEVDSLVLERTLRNALDLRRGNARRATIGAVADGLLDALRGLIAGNVAGTGVREAYPLAPIQKLHLLTDRADDPGFEQWRYRLEGPLDVAALQAAWQTVIDRHTILRTSFLAPDGAEPLQRVHDRVVLPWTQGDLRDLPEAEREAAIAEHLRADRARGFDFAQAPLLRIFLARTGQTSWTLVWSHHHLLLDRWSWPLVLGEIEVLYRAQRTGAVAQLPPPVPYGAYLRYTTARPLAEAEAFWRDQFTGYDAGAARRAAPATEREASVPIVRLEFSAAETAALRARASASSLAVNAFICGAWALRLAHHLGRSDVVFGLSVAGRAAEVPGIERMIGVTIADVPLRTRLAAEGDLGAWLREMQSRILDLDAWSFAPPDAVHAWSGVPWHRRLFETLLVFQHAGAAGDVHAWLGPDIAITQAFAPTRTAFPLALVVAGDERLSLRADYDPRFFTADGVGAMLARVRTLLLAMSAAELPSLAELRALLPASEYGAGMRGDADGTAAFAARAPYFAPETDAEEVVAAVFAEMLGCERIGRDDDFFALGGQSLLAMRTTARLGETFRRTLPIRLLFEAPTVRRVVRALIAGERKPGATERLAAIVRQVQRMSREEVTAAGAVRENP